MPTNPDFANYDYDPEQYLIEDLIIEAYQIFGRDVYYMPRTLTGGIDPLYHEAPVSTFDRAYMIEMYINDSGRGFGGPGDFLAMDNLEIRDTVTLSVARRTFINEVGDYDDQIRPLEGDLVCLSFPPYKNKIFQVKFVEDEAIFYQMGGLQIWQLNCELFQYSGEVFSTGLPFIDSLTSGYDLNILGTGLVNEDGTGSSIAYEEDGLPILFEDFVDNLSSTLAEENDYYQVEGQKVIDFTEIDPFSNVIPY